jgi:hypothetical protein
MRHAESFPIPFVGIVLSVVWLATLFLAIAIATIFM